MLTNTHSHTDIHENMQRYTQKYTQIYITHKHTCTYMCININMYPHAYIHATSFMKRHKHAGNSSYTFMNTHVQFNTYTKIHMHTHTSWTILRPRTQQALTMSQAIYWKHNNWYAQRVSWSGQFIVDLMPVSRLHSLLGVRGRSDASGQKWERWQ